MKAEDPVLETEEVTRCPFRILGTGRGCTRGEIGFAAMAAS